MEARTLAQLEADVREELDDALAPFLWSSDRIRQLLNEAVAEANLRARLITDSATPTVCRIELVPGQSEYDLDRSIIVIRRAVLASQPQCALTRTKSYVLDRCSPGWRTHKGRPEYLVRDQRNLLILSPAPTIADQLQLTVWRNPLESEQMEGDADDPSDAGIEAIWHSKLVHWACFRALSKTDAEAETPSGARMHYEMFEAAFGPRPTASQLEQLSIDPVTGTEAVWF